MKVLFIPFREMYETQQQREMIAQSASSRIRVDYLVKYWHDAEVWSRQWGTESRTWRDYDVYVFQKAYSSEMIQAAGELKAVGKKIVFDLCDAEWVYPSREKNLRDMMKLADHVTCSSFYIMEYVIRNYHRPATLILDRYDLARYPREKMKHHTESKWPTIVWYGNRNTAQYLSLIEPAILRIQPPFNLLLIADELGAWLPAPTHQYKLHFRKWDLSREIENITTGDVVISPHGDDDIGKAKSDNKTSLAWALGMPVVSHGNEQRIASLLAHYLRHPEIRQEVGRIGRDMVERFYDVRLSVIEWQRVIQSLYV
jgi:hypothetical protein